ncbi:MAG: Fe-S cluster assembly protein SufB [Puniceicoccales bacterium]|jgi:Fe-S cluster assembly protein SufB|nr:Fe-S cluster assembly protein SufB [Puniceicoccales bacterium]
MNISNNLEELSDHGDFHYNTSYEYDAGLGLSEKTIEYISKTKSEDDWLLAFRKKAYEIFKTLALPTALKKDNIDFNNIRYYLSKGNESKRSWDEVPTEIKKTFDRLGIPEKEKKYLAGVEAQFDSESAYSRIKDTLAKDGVIFVDSTIGLKNYPEIFKKFFGTVVPAADNKFSALNSAVFSGGSFIYVPPGVKVKQPLQAYFRINAKNFGQFERTLIVVDEGAELTYMEGCTAPKFETTALHAAVVEIIAKKNSKLQYITAQNWSNNVYNLVTKRGLAYENAEIKWIDCNIGSKKTMKYPCIILSEERAKGEILSVAIASHNQLQDTGAKIIHQASSTTSNILSKSISIGTGLASYKGLVNICENASNCRNNTRCDALLINQNSRTETYPIITVCGGRKNYLQHEASISKIDDEKLYYLQQRGIREKQAISLIINGFVNDLINEFPLEYGIEIKRLIELEIDS